MPTCNDTQKLLRERFDAGLALNETETGHVDTCIVCQAYRARLNRLNDALFAMPLEPFPDALASGILHRVYDYREENRLSIADGVTLLTALGLITAALGWYFPIAIDPTSIWSHAQAWLISVDPAWSAAILVEQLDQLRAAAESGFTSAWMPSRLIIWSALLVTFSGVVMLNGYVALRLRTTGD
jgi:hypothetical protein